MKILDHEAVAQKIKRLAYQIAEQNHGGEPLYLLGINNNGKRFAGLLEREIKNTNTISVIPGHIRLNPAAPADSSVEIDLSLEELNGKPILIIDDVANTGRTLFYAFSALMKCLPGKVQVGVLVDRQHKHFPVQVDYVGLSLATTLKDHIVVDIETPGRYSVHLE